MLAFVSYPSKSPSKDFAQPDKDLTFSHRLSFKSAGTGGVS
jgi:hypothetical protein